MEKEKETKEKSNHQTTTHILTLVIVVILGFAFVMFVFGVGIWVGQKRAEFSFRFAENYHRNFGGPTMGIFDNFPKQDFTNGHGLFGQVLSIDGSDIIIKGQDNVEKTVVVSPQTTIMSNASKEELSDIKVNDSVVIIGAPDMQGQVQAKFIRIFPAGTSMVTNIPNVNI